MTDSAHAEAALLHALDEVSAELADPRLARQFELEAEMIEDGASRYWDRVTSARPGTDAEGRFTEGEESRTPTSQCLMRLSLNPVRDGILAFLEKAATGGAGRRHAAVKHLKLVEPETAAFLAVKRCLDSFSLNLPQSTLCIRMGRAIEDEVRLRTFEDKAAGLLKAIRERFATGNFKHQRRVLNALAQRHEIDLGERWTETEALHVGAALLTIVIERTGLFQLVSEQFATEVRSTVQPTPETLEWVRKRDAAAQFLLPTYMPTVVPPKPWTGPRTGGYHFGLARKLKLVKHHGKGYQSELRHWEMPAVYEAVNALQNTAWAVNHRVLDYIAPAARAGFALAGLPETRLEEVGPCPADIPQEKEQRTEEQHNRLVAWKSQARAIHEANLERRQKGLVLARCLAIAERYAKEEEFFFPYTLDFRGRAYPATSFLHPQGCDYQKALLRFSEGKPLGEQGACWLAIHGGNLMAEDPTTGQKIDKAPLQDRIDWVTENEALILATAADPDASDWWTKADSPWQFLAFCFEWAGYVAEGESFVSHLPIALDGSCNGLQHFSAMLRDEVGGSAVNLIPHDRPADIYMEVCRKALEVCAFDAAKEPQVVPALPEDADEQKKEDPEIKAARKRNSQIECAKRWIASGQINRSLCKRPVMTMPYGSKQFGIRDQLVQELRSRDFAFPGIENPARDDTWAMCSYLSGVIWEALAGVVVKAREAMDWLQSCAKLAASEGLPINWTTPAGFWVQQDYRETHSVRVKSQVAGTIYWPRLDNETETTAKAKQQNGVAPNFVHSMDAAAMMLCISEALGDGIRHFAMIHDSYATHAGATDAFYRCIRQSFINLYDERDVLMEFHDQIANSLSEENREKLPLPPKAGNLDLRRVAESDFFFA